MKEIMGSGTILRFLIAQLHLVPASEPYEPAT